MRWKLRLGLFLTIRAVFDLGIDVVHHFFKNDINQGASFMRLTRNIAEVFATALPHLFTSYPHYAVHRKCGSKMPAAQQQDFYIIF